MKRAVLVAFALTGCVNEYHPEYHPVTIVSVDQRVPVPATHEHVTLRAYPAPDPDLARMFSPEKAEDPFVIAAPVPSAELLPPPTVDPSTPSPMPRRGGVYIGDGVRINGNVTINGDVYITTTRTTSR